MSNTKIRQKRWHQKKVARKAELKKQRVTREGTTATIVRQTATAPVIRSKLQVIETVDKKPDQSVAPEKDRENKDQHGNRNRRKRGSLFPLWKIAEGPSTRTSAPGDPHDRGYIFVTRHLFNLSGTKEFKTMFLIPKNAEIVLVPENEDTPAHYRVPVGDAFVYISTEFGKVESGMSIEGWAELKVKAVKRPNIGPRVGFYPYANIWRPLEENQLSEFILELDSKKEFVAEGDFAFTPSSGNKKTILRMSGIDKIINITKA